MSIKLVAEVFDMPLKPNEKLVLLALADCANDDGFAYPGYKKLIQKTSLARATLAKNLKILELAGLFKKEGHAAIGVGKSVNTYQLFLPECYESLKENLEKARDEVSKSSRDEPPKSSSGELGENPRKVQTLNRKVQSVKSSPDEPRKVQGVNSKSSTVEHEPSVLTVSKEPSVEKQAKKNPPDEKPEKSAKRNKDVFAVFGFWKTTMGHLKAKLDPKRKKVIEAALSWEYSVADLCQAIDGCSKTPHNIGQNDRGQRYDGLNIILRDADQIDRFMANSVNPPREMSKQDKLEAHNLAVLAEFRAKQANQGGTQ